MRHRIGANKDFKPVHISGHLLGPRRNATYARPVAHLLQTVLDGRHRIGAGANSRVQKHHPVIGESQHLAEAVFQQLTGKAHLKFDHLSWCVIHTIFTAQFRVIGGEKVLVEIEPYVRVSFQKIMWVKRLKRSFQQLEPDAQFFIRLILTKQFQRTGQQSIATVQHGRRIRHIKRCRAVQSRQKHRIGHRLGVGVGKLRIIGIREEIIAPFIRQKTDCRPVIRQRDLDLITKEAGQGSQILRKRCWQVRNYRAPSQKVTKQPFKIAGIVRPDCILAIGNRVTRQPYKRLSVWTLPVPIE